ncbi:MAG: DUF3887 domain-containing protein [Lachnospiraceae bacterium]|nr:DUF3887 domain-containing protein [Lachnospiraceae bacterium]
MTADQYVKNITNQLKCGGKRRNEIRQELLSEINARREEGLSFDEIMEQMGSVSDVVNSFNDNMSDAEKKKYKNSRTLMVLIPVLLFLAFLTGIVIFLLPKSTDLSGSRYFTEATVTEQLKKDITLLNNGDYETLRRGASEAMQTVLKDGLMDSVQQQTGGDWGAFDSFGEVQIAEISQAGQHYAVAEIRASYENINVTYRITYDRNMKLAGLYVR